MSETEDMCTDVVGIGVWDWNVITGEFVYDNGWAGMHGYSQDELEGCSVSPEEIVHPDYLAEISQIFSDQSDGKRSCIKVNCFVQRKDGCWLWSNICSKVVATDESCRPTRIIGIHQKMSGTGSDEETFFEEMKKSGFCDGPIDKDGAVVFTTDCNGNIICIGRKIEKILGYTVEELVGRKIHDFAAEEDRANLRMLIENGGNNRTESPEICFNDNSGNKVRFLTYTRPVSHKKSKRYGILVDTTANKQTEPDSEVLRHAIKSFAYPFALTDLDGIITYVNRATLEQWGYDDGAEMLGMPYLSFFVDDIKYRVGYEQIIRESGWGSEVVGQRKDGSLFDCMFFGQIVRDKTGRPTNLVATCFDTSEQKNAERELLWSEERFRGLSMAAPDAIIMGDSAGRITFWNNTAETLFGCCAGEIIGSDFSIFIPDEFYEDYIKKIGSLDTFAVSKSSRKPFEWQLNRKDDERFFAEISVSPIKIDGKWNIIADIRDISWRKQMEKSLRESEELYRLVFERTGTAMLIIGEDNTILHANRKMEEMSGYLRDEVVGRTKWTEYIVDEDLKRLLKYYPLNKTGQEWIQKEFEITFIAKTGPKFASVIISLIPGTKEHIVSVMDITERKRAEESLRASERKYREMTDLLPQTVFECDPDRNILFTNRAGFEAFGYTIPDLQKGVNIDRVFIPEDIERLLNNFNISLNDDIVPGYGYMALRKDGSTFPATVYSCPIMDQDEIVGLRGIIVDVTDIRNAEQELRDSEERLNLAIDSAKLGVWDVDLLTGRELYNKCWASIIGRSYDKNGGHKDKWLDLLHPDDRPRVEVEIDEYLKGKAAYYNTEFRMKCSDGRWKWVSSHGGIAEQDSNGRPTRMVGIHRDITEIRQYKEALKMANTKLNLLSGITRHDILNQVTILNGYGKLLEMSIPDNPNAQKYLDQIMGVSDTISQQIGFTKDYQDMGINAPKWQCVDTVIRKVLESPLYKGFDVKIKTGLLEIYADPMLERVFYNLFDNAHGHGGGVTEITVSSRQCDDDSIIITIEDNGIGIPEYHKKRIFEKGFGSNTGLGLFLVREILAITAFTIRETGEYGQGACFELSVPGEAFRKASFDETG